MSEGSQDEGQEKSFEPTPEKLRKAREEGRYCQIDRCDRSGGLYRPFGGHGDWCGRSR